MQVKSAKVEIILFYFVFISRLFSPFRMHYAARYFLLITVISLAFCEEPTTVIVLEQRLAIVYCEDSNHAKQLDSYEYKLFRNYSLENTQSIEFRSCNFPQLPQTFLQRFVGVKEIDLSFRRIQSVKSEDFRSNNNLVKLYLNHNHLTELPAHLFKYTPKMEEITFSYNKIEIVDPDAFADGERLRKIDLKSNMIKTLDGRLFRNAVSLKNVDLSLNVIEYFGLKPIKLIAQKDLNSLEYSSPNCLILPYKKEKTVSIDVFQLYLKKDSLQSLQNVEINCNSGKNKKFFFRNELSTKVDGITMVINV